jgi:ergothioneine biosynthesis protein EgtB
MDIQVKDKVIESSEAIGLTSGFFQQKFNQVRSKTEELCKPLIPEDFVAQPVIDVSPPKWHLGHTTWFFEEFILTKYKNDYKVFDKDYRFLFNSYYNTIGDRVKRNNRGNLTRPPLSQVYEYRHYVNYHINELLKSGAYPDSCLSVLEIGLQHEQQHQELFMTDIKFILYQNPLLPAYLPNEPARVPNNNIANSFLEIEEGIYTVGYQGEAFSFDNERGEHKVYVHAFRVMDRLVTNREYLEFMKEGGYKRFDFWLSDAWDWVVANDIKSPLYWECIDGEWFQFTHYGLTRLQPDEPVSHISYYEADAYAAWAGKRLLTEFEWEVAARKYSPIIPEGSNFQDQRNYIPLSKGNENLQFFGDCWEWTSSAYLPYPFYKKEPGALGEYNGKFMVNQMVLRGGACVTPVNHIRHSYRNFFNPHLQWQFSGIRLAENF